MIVNIDNSESVKGFVSKIAENWFNPETMYSDLKANGKTASSGFWGIPKDLLNIVSEYLNQTSNEFVTKWNEKCSTYDTKIMGYHCTRHSNEKVFAENGVLPLSDETITIAENINNNIVAKETWESRSQKSPGPWFLLSYEDAKNPNNDYCINGPEILRACSGHQPNVDTANSIPLILHCAIPYSMLHDKNYFIFCILRAYFNFIDPEDGFNFNGYSIDLAGRKLEPMHIINYEKI